MTEMYSETHTEDDETRALTAVAGEHAYVFVAIDTEADPPLIRLVCGNGPTDADDIDLMLRAALRQLQRARES